MTMLRTMLAPLLFTSIALVSCGGGGGEGVTEQAGDVAAAAAEAATKRNR